MTTFSPFHAGQCDLCWGELDLDDIHAWATPNGTILQFCASCFDVSMNLDARS
jgi:hypothetical protein